MKEILDYIDELINGCFSPENNPYGLCRLIKDDNQTYYPITIEGNEKVTPDDRYPIAWYHRLLNGDPEGSEDFSFGRRARVNINQQIRTVLIVQIDQGDDVVTEFINSMPDKVTYSGYKFVEVSKEVSLIRDHDQVWEDEWDASYKDKHQMRYYLYAIEWRLEYIKCDGCN